MAGGTGGTGHLGLALNHVLRDLTLEFNTGGVEPRDRAAAQAILGQSMAILCNPPRSSTFLVSFAAFFSLLLTCFLFLLPSSSSLYFFAASFLGLRLQAERGREREETCRSLHLISRDQFRVKS